MFLTMRFPGYFTKDERRAHRQSEVEPRKEVVTIDDVYETIRYDFWKPITDEIRAEYIANGKSERYKELRTTKLLTIFPACTWEWQNGKKTVDVLSGYTQHDYDNLSYYGTTPEAVIADLRGMPEVILAFRSPSGNGIKFICDVSFDGFQYYPFGDIWDAQTKLIHEKCPALRDVPPDIQPRAELGLTYICYDENVYYNPCALPEVTEFDCIEIQQEREEEERVKREERRKRVDNNRLIRGGLNKFDDICNAVDKYTVYNGPGKAIEILSKYCPETQNHPSGESNRIKVTELYPGKISIICYKGCTKGRSDEWFHGYYNRFFERLGLDEYLYGRVPAMY